MGDQVTPHESTHPADTQHPDPRTKAEELLREHWQEMGLDPDTMATLDTLGEGERETWLERGRDALTEQHPDPPTKERR